MKISHAASRTGHPMLGLLLGFVVLLTPIAATAQSVLRPAPRPLVTAEHERWYLEGQPIGFWGNIYYPAGAAVFFNPYEMTRSGDYRGIPLYSIKTREPYAVVYVPLPGGLLQPYERRRDGDIAGTVGSLAPSFPVARDSDPTSSDDGLQAAGSPVLRDFNPSYGYGPAPARTTWPATSEDSIDPRSVRPEPLGPLATALRPTGLNAFFIDYDGRRWFSNGPTVLLDRSSFTTIGDYYGFPVYSGRGQSSDTIYVPVAADVKGLLTPYSTRD